MSRVPSSFRSKSTRTSFRTNPALTVITSKRLISTTAANDDSFAVKSIGKLNGVIKSEPGSTIPTVSAENTPEASRSTLFNQFSAVTSFLPESVALLISILTPVRAPSRSGTPVMVAATSRAFKPKYSVPSANLIVATARLPDVIAAVISSTARTTGWATPSANVRSFTLSNVPAPVCKST